MANLDGSRSHGGKHDIQAGAMLRDEPAHFTHIYRMLITAARAEGIGADRPADFLGLEHGGEFDVLGQDELGPSALENAFKDQIDKARCRRYLDRAADRAHPAGRGQGGAACVRPERVGQLRRAVRVLWTDPGIVRC